MEYLRNKYLYIAGFLVIVMVLVVSVKVFILHANKKNNSEEASVVTEIQPAPQIKMPDGDRVVIGKSVSGRSIEAYTYGNGLNHLLFVGGIHGGYEWNSILLAYQVMDYIHANPTTIPKNVTITIIPDANPDGLYKVTKTEGRFTEKDLPAATQPAGTGRFNIHDVDLNRNFDCKWKPKSTWQNTIVNAGSKPFSEPETQTLRDFISKYNPQSAVFWHSKSNGVYASQCENGILPKTLDIMNAYADASGYPAIKVFGAYETTGAADDWLASLHVPAITVELATRESTEFDKNIAGFKAILNYFK